MRTLVSLSALLIPTFTLGCGQDADPGAELPSSTTGGQSTMVTGGAGGSVAGESTSGGSEQSGTGGVQSSSGSGGGSPSGTGGSQVSSSSGGSTSVGEGPAVLAEFSVYWDFETVEENDAISSVGDVRLQLFGSQVESGVRGNQMSVGADTAATTSAPPVDSSKDFSVSAWVKLNALDGYDTFVGLDGESVGAFFLQKRDDDRLSFASFSRDDTSTSACVATAQIRPRAGAWYHVVGTWNSATHQQRIFVDGVLSGQVNCPQGIFQARAGLSVGRGLYDGQASDPWTGAIDDLGLIDRVLSPAEIVELYRFGRPDQKNYLFAYFVEVSQGRGDGLRLAHSHDGLHWGAIGANKVFMPASVGGGSFRDPHLMRTPDGIYHLVWTTSCVPWAEANCVQDRGLGHATSADLVEWSAANYITVDLNVEHVWAPESFYDTATQQIMIFWSSPIDQNPAASDPHNIYYVLTRDFMSFTEPQILYSRPGRNFIDATILDRGTEYLMVLKDEADGQKNLRALTSTQLFGAQAWAKDPSAPLTGNYAAEGPSFLERDGKLYVYFDKYGEGAYGAIEATSSSALDSPAAWRDISTDVFFPGVRHGSPIEVPWEVFEAVAKETGR